MEKEVRSEFGSMPELDPGFGQTEYLLLIFKMELWESLMEDTVEIPDNAASSQHYSTLLKKKDFPCPCLVLLT